MKRRFPTLSPITAGGLLIFFAMILWGFDSPLTVIVLLTGMGSLLLGCFLWAHKLPWHAALIIGGIMFAAAWFAAVYVPLIVSYKGEGICLDS